MNPADLQNLASPVAITLILAGVIIWKDKSSQQTLKDVNEVSSNSHKEKTVAFLQVQKEKDDMIRDIFTKTIEATSKTTDAIKENSVTSRELVGMVKDTRDVLQRLTEK